jgi:hypothetical protein
LVSDFDDALNQQVEPHATEFEESRRNTHFAHLYSVEPIIDVKQ